MLFTVLLFALCCISTADLEASGRSSSSVEILSVLDFSADSKPASENDREGQLKLRSTRYWGRLHLDGWPQSIQYFRAHFGIEPPIGRKTFVFPEPRDGCSDVENAAIYTSDHVLLMKRGNCTFGTKAKLAAKTAASGVIIINNEPGIEHFPGPDAADVLLSVTSIPWQDGQLLEKVYDQGPFDSHGLGAELQGYLVPVNCGGAETGAAAVCEPATFSERKNILELSHGGVLVLKQKIDLEGWDGNRTISTLENGSGHERQEIKLEYLLATFGVKVPHTEESLPALEAVPADACTPLENKEALRNKVVLVRRGGCNFARKVEEVQAAGGRAVCVGNDRGYLTRMGVEPRWKGLSISIPVFMVSNSSYSMLVSLSKTETRISFEEDTFVSSAVWESIEKLYSSESKDGYEELLERHKLWPNRIAAVREALDIRQRTQSNTPTQAQTQSLYVVDPPISPVSSPASVPPTDVDGDNRIDGASSTMQGSSEVNEEGRGVEEKEVEAEVKVEELGGGERMDTFIQSEL